MIKDKILSLKTFEQLLPIFKKKRQKIVFTNGCFDILHFGHVRYLEEAKRLGDLLVVGLNKDASIKRLKGEERPINVEKNRAGVLAALESIDYVIPFGEDTPLKLIKRITPDVLCKGSDWGHGKIVGEDWVREHGGLVKRIRLSKGLSTTNTIDKIKQVS